MHGDERYGVDIAGIDPSKAITVSKTSKRGCMSDSPFSWDTFEVCTLIAVFGIDLVRIKLSSNVVLLNDSPIEVAERLRQISSPATERPVKVQY